MSCQRGNSNRSRSQKYQNQTSFKNNLHDNSQKTKVINSIEVANVCKRCKNIIKWKIKYKKYKMSKVPMKCTKCGQKTVKHSYHNICLSCAKQQKICPKCGEKKEIVEGKPSMEEQLKLDAEFQEILKTISERKRRTLLRYMNQELNLNKADSKDGNEAKCSKSREDLLIKLKSLAITEGEDDNLDDDNDNEKEYDNLDYDINDL